MVSYRCKRGMKANVQTHDSTETVHGRVNTLERQDPRRPKDIQTLLQCIADLDDALEYFVSERGLRDSMARLYCMSATVICGATATVPLEDGDLRDVLANVASDLADALALFERCINSIEPLQRLPA